MWPQGENRLNATVGLPMISGFCPSGVEALKSPVAPTKARRSSDEFLRASPDRSRDTVAGRNRGTALLLAEKRGKPRVPTVFRERGQPIDGGEAAKANWLEELSERLGLALLSFGRLMPGCRDFAVTANRVNLAV